MQKYILAHSIARQRAKSAIDNAPDGYVMTIAEPSRNTEQNAMMWALLSDIAHQCQWHGIKLSSEEWKDLLSAGLVKSKVVPNIEGNGFVILGQRTSKMSKRHFADLITLIQHFGDERGVKWSKPDEDVPSYYRANF
jgi:hypothetical protein